MIIDTSAAVALLRGEPEAESMRASIEAAPRLAMSAASVLELAIVTAASGPALVDRFLAALDIDVLPVDAAHLRYARDAHLRFGRGSGSRARLNFGDCLAYAASRATGEPLLFKGDDFPGTDVVPAL
ncbi:type II toxin-antitoxin system VapC family toxin [Brachybacterium huguangmaarense]